MPFQAWVANVNSPGEGAGTALSNSTSPTDISPAPQYMSQTYGPTYVGQRWRFTGYGIVSNTSTPTLNLGIYYGGASGTALCTTGAVTTTGSLSSYWWRIQVETEIRSIGSSGTAWSQGWFDNPTTATAVTRLQMSATSQTVTVNTTTNSALTVGATWGTASSSNTITCEGFIVEQMN